MTPLGKLNAARFGAAAAALAFVCAAVLPNQSPQMTMWLALAGAMAAVFPLLWGRRLLRYVGTGLFLIGSVGTVIIFVQEHDLDVELQWRWSGKRPCSCGVEFWFRIPVGTNGLSALVPLQPYRKVTTNPTPAGPLVITRLSAPVTPTVAFGLDYCTLPTNLVVTDPARFFAAALKQVLGTDGHLTSKQPVRIGGYPGEQWTFEQAQGRTVVTMRYYLVERDVYDAMCVMPKGRVCQRHLGEFLDGLEFKRK